MKSWKRVLSLLLVLLMCLSLLPASALAEGEEELVAAESEQEVLLPAPEEPAAEETAPAEPEAVAEAEVPTEEAAPAAEKPEPEKSAGALAVESDSADNGLTIRPVLDSRWDVYDAQASISLPLLNEGVSMQVVAEGEGHESLSYSWFVNNDEYVVGDTDKDTLTLGAVLDYTWCELTVSDQQGNSVFDYCFYISLNPPAEFIDLTADDFPYAVSLEAGETKYFRFKAQREREHTFRTGDGSEASLVLYDRWMSQRCRSFESHEVDGVRIVTSLRDSMYVGETFYLAVSAPVGAVSTTLSLEIENSFRLREEPRSVQVKVGGSARLNLVGEGEPPVGDVSYSWYDPDGTLLATTEESFYDLTNVTKTDYYRWEAQVGSDAKQSGYFYVGVVYDLSIYPKGSYTYYLMPGQTQTLEVEIDGDDDWSGMSLQWYYLDEETWSETPIAGETGLSYTFTFDGEPTTYSFGMKDPYGNSVGEAYFYIKKENHFKLVPDYSGDWTWDEKRQEVVILLPLGNDGVTLKVHAEGDDLSQLSDYSWGWSSDTKENVKSVSEDTLVLGPVTKKQRCYVWAQDGFGGFEELDFFISVDNGLGITPVLENGWTLDEDGTVLITLPKENAGVTLRANIAANDPSDMQIMWQVNSSYDIFETLEGENSSSLATGPIESDTTYDLYVTDRYGTPALQSYHVVVDENYIPLPTDYVDLTADNRLLAMDIGVDETKWVRFIPTESRWYRFQTESGYTVSLDFYDEAMNPLSSGQNFWTSAEEMGAEPWASGAEIRAELESGKTYYLAVRSYQGGSGSTVLTYWGDENFYAYASSWTFYTGINEPVRLGVVLNAEQEYQVSYRWYAPDGTLLAVTEAPEYELAVAERSGNYRCVVRDVFGHTSSVTLSVHVNNDIWITPMDGDWNYLENGQTQTLEAAIYGPGDRTGVTFQWYRLSGEEEQIPGETGLSYTFTFDGNPVTYCCRMTDAYGNTSSAYFDIRLDNHFRLVPDFSGNWTWNEENHEIVVLLPPNNDGVALKVRAEGDDLSQFSGYSWGWSSDAEENVKSVSENTLVLGPVAKKQFCYVYADDGFGCWKDLNFIVSVDNGLGITPVLENGWTLDEDGTVLITLPRGNAGVMLRADIAANDPSNMQIMWQINRSEDIFETLEGETSTSYATGPVENDTIYDLYITDRYGTPALQSYRIVVDGEMGAPEQYVMQSYLMLTVGETARPEFVLDMSPGDSHEFRITDENGKEYASEADAVISVDGDGNVTALKVGTAYLVADLNCTVGYDPYTGEPVYGNETVRCRVDVIPAENEEGEELVNPVDAEVTRLTLRDAKATTELYSTNYTQITVLAETERLAGHSATAILEEEEIPVPKDQGVAIESAWFTGAGSELFELKVVDDRTLAIVPTYDALLMAQAKAANVKKSYTFGINVTLSDGTSKIVEAVNGKPAALALTVKQTMPALKASALKFNSLVPGDWKSFGFTGNVVTALEPDYAAAAKAKKDAVPAWLDYGSEGANLMENAPAKASGKLYLLATLEGWAVKKPITVSYSVAATAPTISFKPATFTLQGINYGGTSVTVKPGAFAKSSDFHMEFVIKEKVKVNGKQQEVVHENGTVLELYPYFYNITEKQAPGGIDIYLGPDYVDGNHTYTVQARIYKGDTPCGAAKSFTVKTVAEDRTLKISQYNSIEVLGNTGYISLSASFKNYSTDFVNSFNTEIRYLAPGSKTEVPVKINVFQYGERPDDYSEEALFDVHPNTHGVSIFLTLHEEPQVKKGTYYAYTTATFADGTPSDTVRTKLNIKWTDPAKIKLATVKAANATGTIDPVRYESGVTFILKGSNNNYYGIPTDYDPETGTGGACYVITETIGKVKRELSEAENPFNVYDSYLIVKNYYYPAVRVSLRDDAVLNPKASYSIKFDFRNYVGIESYSVDYKLPIKMAAVKLNALSPVKLLLSDRYSNGEFDIVPKDSTVKAVKSVTLDTNSAKLFELHEVGIGRWAIGFKDNKIPAGLKLGGSKTVKLSITFEGNETGKANTTVSLKVNLK